MLFVGFVLGLSAKPAASGIRTAGKASKDSALGLAVLSTVPLAFGTYATAVQLAGPLSDREAVLLQCGTYGVACLGVLATRLGREGHTRVQQSTIKAGCELGGWIVIAATLQSLGLQRTTAARAGFLVRLSTVIVPFGEAVARRQALPRRVAAAVVLSVLGVALMLTPGSSGAMWQGDCLVALAAVFYSAHILRLGELAPRHDAWPLASAKGATQFGISAALFALQSARGLAPTIKPTRAPAPLQKLAPIACFTGLVTCAFPMWAQSFGQRRVRPSHAALIYATAPVWNAVIAAAVLGQRLTLWALLGAGFMMAGMLLAIAEAAAPRG